MGKLMREYEIVRYIMQNSSWEKPKIHIGLHTISIGQARFSSQTSEQMIMRGQAQLNGNNTPTDKALAASETVDLEVLRELKDVTKDEADLAKDRILATHVREAFDLIGRNRIGEARMKIIKRTIDLEALQFYRDNREKLEPMQKVLNIGGGKLRAKVVDNVLKGMSIEDSFNLVLTPD